MYEPTDIWFYLQEGSSWETVLIKAENVEDYRLKGNVHVAGHAHCMALLNFIELALCKRLSVMFGFRNQQW